MNPKKYNKEFSIFVYDENPVQARFLKEMLLREGYEVHFYTSEELLLQAIYLALPHIVILPLIEKTTHLSQEIQKMSQEIQIFVTCATTEAERAHRLLEQEVIYDYVLDPVALPGQLAHRVSRGVEAWLFRMAKEAPATVVAEKKTETKIETLEFIEVTEPTATIIDSGIPELLLCESEEVAVHFSLKRLQDQCRRDFVYLKYDFENEALQLVDVASGMTARHRKIGVKLEGIADLSHFFAHPQDYKIWADFFTHVFHADQTRSFVVQSKELVFGILVATDTLSDAHQNLAQQHMRALSLMIDGFFKSRLIYDHIPVELKTYCLNNKTFYEKLNNEVSRSRRHQNVLSVLSFEVRSSQGLNNSQTQKAMALLAKIAKRFTRSSDFVGRIADCRLAIALPQTEQEKAAFVASRLTMIVQKALAEVQQSAEVFCGVSTFPLLANDTMSLLEGSEQAVSQAGPFEVVLYNLDEDNQPFVDNQKDASLVETP